MKITASNSDKAMKVSDSVHPSSRRPSPLSRHKATTSLGTQRAAVARKEEVAPPWLPVMESRGFGDTVAKMTHAVGIVPCGGCKDRQQWFNKWVPYTRQGWMEHPIGQKLFPDPTSNEFVP